MNRLIVAVFLGALNHPQGCLQTSLADAPRPNVIVILADDQGAMDLGAYGAKDLHTPLKNRQIRIPPAFMEHTRRS